MSSTSIVPPGYGADFVSSQLGQYKVRGLGAVSIKNVHAVLRGRLGAGPLASGTFPRLAWHLSVIIVGDGADQAEVGDGLIGPYTAAVLRVCTRWTAHRRFLLERHLAVIEQILGRWRYV